MDRRHNGYRSAKRITRRLCRRRAGGTGGEENLVAGNEIGSGFHPDHAEDRGCHGRNAGVQEGQRPQVAQKTTMALRMVLFVGRFEGGGLRHQNEAQ